MDISRSVSRTKHIQRLVDPRGAEAIRIAAVYSALFFLMGIHLPYWPVWLAARGMDPERVGILLGIGLWARALVNPIVGRFVDRTGRSGLLVRALAVGTIIAYLSFGAVEGFWGLLVLCLGLGLVVAPIMPLVDGQAVTAAAAGRLDYGRVRSWGSAAFIAASLLGGVLLEGRPEELIRWTLVGAAAALVVGAWILPATPPRPKVAGPVPGLGDLLRRPGVVLFLVTAGVLQGSHAVLYGFGTAWWRALDIDESTIGALWAEGVVVEIGLLRFGDRIGRRFGASGLLALAGMGGIIRWPALAVTSSLPALFAIQSLHALTFAAMHMGAMTWIRDHVEGAAVHRATALYTAIAGGLALGVGLPTAGALYESSAGHAYVYMAIPSAAGLLLALRLGRERTPLTKPPGAGIG